MITDIVFDIHGVLVPERNTPTKEFNESCSKIISKKFNISEEDGRVIYRILRKYHASSSFLMISLGVYKEYLEGFHNIPVLPSRDEELNELLKKLASQYTLHIITNNPDFYANKILEEAGIDKSLFKNILYAHEEIEPKPSIEPFKLLANGDANCYIYLGDRYEGDIIPAKKAGMDAILIKNNTKDILRDFLNAKENVRIPVKA